MTRELTLSRLLCATLVVATPSWSWAQPGKDEPRASDAATVEDLSEQAMAKYEAKDYPGAIATYLQAYQIQPAGALLYNIATIYDKKLNQRDLAIEYYRRFLAASDSDPELVRKAVARVQTLENARVASAAAAPEGAATNAAASPRRDAAPVATAESQAPLFTRRTVRTIGIAVTALGAASVATGLVFGYKAKKANDDAGKLCDDTFCYSDRGQELNDDANVWANRSTIVTSAGLVATAAGIVLLVLTGGASSQPADGAGAVSVVPAVSASGPGLVLSGSF